MQHIGQGQIKFLMKQLQPRQRSCNQPRAVIAPPTADDLLLFRPSKNIVIIPNEFDIGLIGILSAKTEVNFRHIRRSTIQNHF